MEAYCERRGLTITARYQEVGKGWTKKRPEFQRILTDARRERFDTIVCWKSDRAQPGHVPRRRPHGGRGGPSDQSRSRHGRHRHEDLRTHGRHRQDRAGQFPGAGNYGQARLGQAGPDARRVAPHGYRTGDGGKPEIYEPEAEVVRCIFYMYVHEGMAGTAICRQLAIDNAPLRKLGSRWHKVYISDILGRGVYKGTWYYGRTHWVATEAGERVYPQPVDSGSRSRSRRWWTRRPGTGRRPPRNSGRYDPRATPRYSTCSSTSSAAPSAEGCSPAAPPPTPTPGGPARSEGRPGAPLSGTTTATGC